MPLIVIPGERRRASRPTAFALTLERGDESATLGISEDELAHGIIVGRSMSDISERLARLTTDVVSRTHLLILREQGTTYAYDLASTFGVFRDDSPVRWTTLGRRATLVLGRGSAAVRLLWRQA
jgi:pSer/pThr/pTyr-binding forkhead associated (FHA) protein